MINIPRSRIRQDLKAKVEPSSTKATLGLDIDTYKRWIEFQFTPEMNWSNVEIYHVKPIVLFNVSDEKELKKYLTRKIHSHY